MKARMPPQVSVVIVNFNSGLSLRSTLESLNAGMAHVSWDGVIVDNGSTDGSEAAATDPRLRLIKRQRNDGFAVAANAGLAATTGQAVLVLNPDCRLNPGAALALLRELQMYPSCGVIGPTILDPSGALQDSARGDPDMLTGLFGRTSALSRVFPNLGVVQRNLAARRLDPDISSHVVDWVSGACMLVRRQASDEIGGFDEGYFLYWEDADFCRRLRSAGWETRYATTATVVHDVGQSSRNAPALANREFHRSAYRYFTTHVAPRRLHPARPLAWTVLTVRSQLKSIE